MRDVVFRCAPWGVALTIVTLCVCVSLCICVCVACVCVCVCVAVLYVCVASAAPNMVGSVAAGGRYDNLVGMFSSSGTQVPCVGISIGIERIFAIMEAKARAAQKLQVEPVQVMVASVGSGMVLDRLRLCSLLWDAGISAQTEYAENPNWKKQIHAADNAGNPFMVRGAPGVATVGVHQHLCSLALCSCDGCALSGYHRRPGSS